MNTWKDVVNACELELKHWYPKQCQNIYDDYYWYYQESTPEHDGGILICKEQPPNLSYRLARPEKLNKGTTVQANLQSFLPIARRLPVLSLNR